MEIEMDGERLAGEPGPRLDTAKLLGFRNVAVVTEPGHDMRGGADLAFTKRGTESVA